MSLSLTYQPTITLPEVSLPTSQTLKAFFRTKAFTIASEIFVLLTIVAAAAIWVFVTPSPLL